MQKESEEREPWAKLIPLTDSLESVNLTKDLYTIGRMPTNDVQIQDIRMSGVHCKIYKDVDGNVWIEDLSTNGTFIENDKIGKGKKKKLASGDKILLLSTSTVKFEEIIGYLFSSRVENEKED